jgi:hypothetical protein
MPPIAVGVAEDAPVRVATTSTLAEQGMSWEQFVEYVRK